MALISVMIGLLAVLGLGGIAAGAGVGGGALYIPLFVALFSDNKLAVPLSKACAFGAAVALYVVNAPRKRPASVGVGTRPVIDYSAALLLEPLTLVGTVIGVRLNKMLPFTVLASTMTAVMVITAFKTIQRARLLRAMELSRQKSREDVEKFPISPSSKSTAGVSTPLLLDGICQGSDTSLDDCDAGVLAVLRRESHQYPFWSIFGLFICWAVALVPTLLLSDGIGLEVECLSPNFFAMLGISCAVLVLVAGAVAVHEMRFQRLKEITGGVIEEGEELQWSPKKILTLSSVSLLAGTFSAMVGIGGSTIKGPFLAHVFSDPSVSTATSAFMLLSTCSSSMVQFIFLGMLPFDLAGVYCLAGFIAAFIGARCWNAFVERRNQRSLLVFILGGYIGIAAVVMCALSIYQYHTGTIPPLSSAC